MMSIVLRLARRRGGRGQRLDVHRSGGFVPTARHNDAVSTGDRTTLVGRDRAMAVAGASLEAALAGLPRIVMVLDDLQWFDAESVRLLDFASRQPDLGPVLLVGTYRDVDIAEDHPLRTVLENLPSEAVLLRLTGLDVDAVGQLLRREGSMASAAAVHRATGGNPFFVRQLIRLGDGGDLGAEVPLAVG